MALGMKAPRPNQALIERRTDCVGYCDEVESFGAFVDLGETVTV